MGHTCLPTAKKMDKTYEISVFKTLKHQEIKDPRDYEEDESSQCLNFLIKAPQGCSSRKETGGGGGPLTELRDGIAAQDRKQEVDVVFLLS